MREAKEQDHNGIGMERVKGEEGGRKGEAAIGVEILCCGSEEDLLVMKMVVRVSMALVWRARWLRW